MKLLLDTHIWIWYLLGNLNLSNNLQKAISDERNELWLSPISIWEPFLLAEKGRLILKPTPEQWVQNSLEQLDTKEAPLSNEIAILSPQLALVHQDPADRFIAATAVHYKLTLVTVDGNLTKATCLSTLS
ncbi:type II toxin-antitoxin system VapC family toxin [Nostoc sp. TCL26-01]|uniref:type II toxin-antitoxin system VapC family toxin n=1 Tax=Nostoc sp. TCL26-01 TaxID=2576904 RepID=UPI0015BC27DE|nr:PIN domain-containing protein [Nostoc sp. TCL26-01]QLE58258.1 type II toxin-antitoxin system VapC family toxin [Nostoc sp. TCL26-01]